MAIQSLQEFQSTFGMDPVEVEVQFGKDAAFSIYLKPLAASARDAFEASVVGEKGKTNLVNLRARLVEKCWVDKEGKPIGDAKQIGAQRSDVIAAIFDKVRELNGMDKDVAKVDEEKND
jgi:hypothetical protein